MKKILVIGSKGQLATCLQSLNLNWTFLDKEQIDLSNLKSIEMAIPQKVECIVNVAAYTQVDKAEAEVQNASIINGEACGILASLSNFYFGISTDYVFSGRGFKPYTESDSCEPTSVYGKSKLQGEIKTFESNKNAVILRTSWLYSEFGNNFLKTMLRLAQDRKDIRVVNDQVGSPTDAMELAKILVKMVERRSLKQKGIFHFSNEGVCSWYDFAVEIFRQSNMPVKVIPISTGEYPTVAQRPHYSVLNKAKIKAELEIEIPHWAESLKNCLNRNLSTR